MERKRKLDIYDEATPAAAAGREGSANGDGLQRDAGDSGINPYTGRPYSGRYYEILAGRKGEREAV